MSEIDRALQQLSSEPAPAELASLEEQVLRRIKGHSFATAGESYRTRVALVGIALFVGIMGGLIPEGSADARQSLTPLTGADKLAPSALLTGPR